VPVFFAVWWAWTLMAARDRQPKGTSRRDARSAGGIDSERAVSWIGINDQLGIRVGAHLSESAGNLAGASGAADIVEQNDFVLSGEAIGHRRIPMVHGGHEIHVEDQRHAAFFAEPAIGEADAVGLDELRRHGPVGICPHVPTSRAAGSAKAAMLRPSETHADPRPRPWAMPSFSSRNKRPRSR